MVQYIISYVPDTMLSILQALCNIILIEILSQPQEKNTRCSKLSPQVRPTDWPGQP